MINKENIIDYISFLYKTKHGKSIPDEILKSWKELDDTEKIRNLNSLYQQWEIDNLTIKSLEKKYFEQLKKENSNFQKSKFIWFIFLSLIFLAFVYYIFYVYQESQINNQTNSENINQTIDIKNNTTNSVQTTGNTIEKKSQPIEIINKWFKSIFNSNSKLNQNDLNNLIISLENYTNLPNNQLRQQLSELNTFLELKPEIKVFPYSIQISYRSESEALSLFFLEDKFIYSLYAGGSNGVSYEYNFKTSQFKQMDFELLSLENRIGIIQRDYFDPRGPDHPNYQGHVYQDGTIDFFTGKINWD